jgi:hypothetical protein
VVRVASGLIPTAMLSSMSGRMMPDALERLKDEAPRGSQAQRAPTAADLLRRRENC